MKTRDFIESKTTGNPHGILLTDGAMGTYYVEKTGDTNGFCELANVSRPDVISDIHKEYLDAGAMLIRTNTFAANRFALKVDRKDLADILTSGYKIAQGAVNGRNAGIAVSVGPIRGTGGEEDGEILAEYLFVAKTMVDAGADFFIFETFSSPDFLCQVAETIKGWNPDAYVLTQFAFSADGLTRDGLGLSTVFDEIGGCPHIDAMGFNCGAGPSQLRRFAERLDRISEPNWHGKPISLLPNASFPEVVNERTVYVNNPDYFASVMEETLSANSGNIRIAGGCCGTTPEHILSLSRALGHINIDETRSVPTATPVKNPGTPKTSRFQKKLDRGEFVIAVELDPPFDIHIQQMVEHARLCGKAGVDMITVADSPRGIARVDSLMAAAMIHRKVGIEVMPHLCCRDKNVNALRSGIMACHIEGIRNILTVTGDPILESDSVTTKSVFNLNAYRLIQLIQVMNREMCRESHITVGAALNVNAKDLANELGRMEKKIQRGAGVFFTQPVFDKKAMDALKEVRKRKEVKIIAGIMPLIGYRNAIFLNNEVPGIDIPTDIVSRFSPDMSREEGEETGIRIAVETASRIRGDVDGFYLIIPFARTHVVLEIINRLRLQGILD